MDMKNATILLIFLLCVLGLIVGAYCTDGSDSDDGSEEYEEVIHEDSNGTITISLDLKQKDETVISRFLDDPTTIFQ